MMTSLSDKYLTMHLNKTLSKKERKYATTFFMWNCNNSILRSSSSSYFLFNYFCPLITSCCLLHFSKDQSEAKLKWQMTPIFFAFVSYIRKLVEEWHWGYTYGFSSYKTLGYYFFVRSSTAGIIRNYWISPT